MFSPVSVRNVVRWVLLLFENPFSAPVCKPASHLHVRVRDTPVAAFSSLEVAPRFQKQCERKPLLRCSNARGSVRAASEGLVEDGIAVGLPDEQPSKRRRTQLGVGVESISKPLSKIFYALKTGFSSAKSKPKPVLIPRGKRAKNGRQMVDPCVRPQPEDIQINAE